DDGKVLVLRRAAGRRHAAGKWEPVSGFFREHECAEVAVTREVAEETGLQTEVVSEGAAFEVVDHDACWIVKPFALRPVGDSAVSLDHEHDISAWLTPGEILGLDCVEGMDRDLAAVGLAEAPVSA